MTTYSVLTLSKYSDHLDRLLTTLFIAQPNLTVDDVYVVDDGINEEIKQKWKVNYIPGALPFCFARNFNIGVAALPKGKDLFFIGDDVILQTEYGIEKLQEHLKKDPSLGIAAPSILGASGNLLQDFGRLHRPMTSHRLQTFGHATLGVTFVATLIKEAILSEVGPIPESLTGYGCEDYWFCHVMRRKGFEWIIDPSVVVIHGMNAILGAVSFNRALGKEFRKAALHNLHVYEQLVDGDLDAIHDLKVHRDYWEGQLSIQS